MISKTYFPSGRISWEKKFCFLWENFRTRKNLCENFFKNENFMRKFVLWCFNKQNCSFNFKSRIFTLRSKICGEKIFNSTENWKLIRKFNCNRHLIWKFPIRNLLKIEKNLKCERKIVWISILRFEIRLNSNWK